MAMASKSKGLWWAELAWPGGCAPWQSLGSLGPGEHGGILAGWLVGRRPTQVHESLSEGLTPGLVSAPGNHQRVLTSDQSPHSGG